MILNPAFRPAGLPQLGRRTGGERGKTRSEKESKVRPFLSGFILQPFPALIVTLLTLHPFLPPLMIIP